MTKVYFILVFLFLVSCGHQGIVGSGVYIGSNQNEQNTTITPDTISSELNQLNQTPSYNEVDVTSILNIGKDSINFAPVIDTFDSPERTVANRDSIVNSDIIVDQLLVPDSVYAIVENEPSADSLIATEKKERVIYIDNKEPIDLVTDTAYLEESIINNIELDTVSNLKQKDSLALTELEYVTQSLENDSLRKETEIKANETDQKKIKEQDIRISNSEGLLKQMDEDVQSDTTVKLENKSTVDIRNDVELAGNDTAIVKKPDEVKKTVAVNALMVVNNDSIGSPKQNNSIPILGVKGDVSATINDSISAQQIKILNEIVDGQKQAQANNQQILESLKSLELQKNKKLAQKEVIDDQISIKKEVNTINFYFETGSRISKNQAELIDSIISVYVKSPQSHVLISGYTDAIGDYSKNNILSLKRAESIKRELIKRGIDERQIYMQYFGEKYSSKSGSALDRKVVVTIN